MFVVEDYGEAITCLNFDRRPLLVESHDLNKWLLASLRHKRVRWQTKLAEFGVASGPNLSNFIYKKGVIGTARDLNDRFVLN